MTDPTPEQLALCLILAKAKRAHRNEQRGKRIARKRRRRGDYRR